MLLLIDIWWRRCICSASYIYPQCWTCFLYNSLLNSRHQVCDIVTPVSLKWRLDLMGSPTGLHIQRVWHIAKMRSPTHNLTQPSVQLAVQVSIWKFVCPTVLMDNSPVVYPGYKSLTKNVDLPICDSPGCYLAVSWFNFPINKGSHLLALCSIILHMEQLLRSQQVAGSVTTNVKEIQVLQCINMLRRGWDYPDGSLFSRGS